MYSMLALSGLVGRGSEVQYAQVFTGPKPQLLSDSVQVQVLHVGQLNYERQKLNTGLNTTQKTKRQHLKSHTVASPRSKLTSMSKYRV